MERTDLPSETSGQAVKPKRKPRPKKAGGRKGGPAAVAVDEGQQEAKGGRLASSVQEGRLEWFLRPWFARGMLSLIAGASNVGKSSFIAHLVAGSMKTMMFTGYEEEFSIMTKPRLVCNGVELASVMVMDDRRYVFPGDLKTVTRLAKDFGAQLITVDPCESYMEDGKGENNGPDVRDFLESLVKLAKDTGAAVVGVRHRGKATANVMPGSRQWEAVPRSVIKLEKDASIPPRYMIVHHKDSLGQGAFPREYFLEGMKGKPRVFRLGKEVDEATQDFSQMNSDLTGRRKVIDAAQLIREMFEKDEKPTVEDLRKKCAEKGISDGARYDAIRALQIRTGAETLGGIWIMRRTQKEWPSWVPETLK